jgi:hypothetical protein
LIEFSFSAHRPTDRPPGRDASSNNRRARRRSRRAKRRTILARRHSQGVTGKTDFGALTEVSNLPRASEEFRRMAPDLPAAAGGENSAPRQRAAAERHRQRGARLLEAGRPAAALAAFWASGPARSA